MSTYLYRLGATAFDHRRAMLAAWLAVFVGVIAAAFAFSGKTNNSFTVPGTESQQAQELLEEKFAAASGAYARMVFEAPEGTTLDDPAVKAGVMASVEQAGTGAEVIGVIDPYTAGTLSADGTIGFADVRYPVSASDLQSQSKDQLEASAAPAEAAGVQVEWAGGVVKTESHSAAEAIGIAVGFLVLAITLGSLLAAGLPLLTAMIGVVIGMMGLTAVTGFVERLRHRTDARHDARPRRRHRLRALHPLAPPPGPARGPDARARRPRRPSPPQAAPSSSPA